MNLHGPLDGSRWTSFIHLLTTEERRPEPPQVFLDTRISTAASYTQSHVNMVFESYLHATVSGAERLSVW